MEVGEGGKLMNALEGSRLLEILNVKIQLEDYEITKLISLASEACKLGSHVEYVKALEFCRNKKNNLLIEKKSLEDKLEKILI